MTKSTDEQARERLFARVRSMQPELPAIQDTRKLELHKETDFASLPGYDEFRMQRDIGAKLGIENPYFRVHEAASGARVKISGRTFLDFSSYDYLGLNGHPE